MKSKYLSLIFSIVLITLFSPSHSQTVSYPDINFKITDKDFKVSTEKIYKTLLSFEMIPAPEVQSRIMNDVLNGIYNYGDIFEMAIKFKKGYTKEVYEHFVKNSNHDYPDTANTNKLTKAADYNHLDTTSQYRAYHFPNTIYQFMCLDFDRDGEPDLLIFPEFYFGPSSGLAFYAKVKGKFQFLFDIGGEIAEIKDNKEKIVIRCLSPIYDHSEPYVVYNFIYNKKTKNAFMDSKLYYSREIRIPDLKDIHQTFKTTDSVYLRDNPFINDTLYDEIKGYYSYKTKVLFGNVDAVYPKESQGFVLYRGVSWAFVAFKPESAFSRSSLKHGMDPFIPFDKSKSYIKPYICGWIPLNKIKTNQ